MARVWMMFVNGVERRAFRNVRRDKPYEEAMKRFAQLIEVDDPDLPTRPELTVELTLDGRRVLFLVGQIDLSAVTAAPVTYAVGLEGPPRSFGMMSGPWPEFNTAVRFEPPEEEGREPVLLRFNRDGTSQVIRRWSGGRWVDAEEGILDG